MNQQGDAPPVTAEIGDDDDGPMDGDWVDCWQCGGEGGEEGTDPFWDLGEWQTCDICCGKGGWVCE